MSDTALMAGNGNRMGTKLDVGTLDGKPLGASASGRTASRLSPPSRSERRGKLAMMPLAIATVAVDIPGCMPDATGSAMNWHCAGAGADGLGSLVLDSVHVSTMS